MDGVQRTRKTDVRQALDQGRCLDSLVIVRPDIASRVRLYLPVRTQRCQNTAHQQFPRFDVQSLARIKIPEIHFGQKACHVVSHATGNRFHRFADFIPV